MGFTLSKHMFGSKFSKFTGDNFFHTYTLEAHVRFKIFKFSQEIIFSCLHSPHMLGSKFSNFHERSFFHGYTLHTCFRIHSPYRYLVYTLQAHVRFKILNFHRSFFFSFLHSPHMFQGSLSIQLFGLHSASTC